jgi:hypothetical protein
MADAVKIIDQSGRQMQPLPTTKADVPAPQNLLEVIARAASDPTVDIDKMDRLLQMREREETRAAEAEFNTAMTAAQTEMGRIKTNKENSQTHSRYADYASLDRALRPIYTRHGFALSFNTVEAPADMVGVEAYVSRGGFTRTYRATMPADGKGARGNDVMTKTHATGAAMTYGMRYLLKMIFNVAIGEDDTDGNMPGTLMTDDQVEKIKDMLEEAATATESEYADWLELFLDVMQVDNVRELAAKDFERSKQAIVAAKVARAKK